VSGEAARRVLGAACCLLFLAAAFFWGFVFLLSFVQFENTDSHPTTLARILVFLLTLASFFASGTSLDYARGPTPARKRRAIIGGAVAVVPVIVLLLASVAISSSSDL
jgi:uncharacterized BrkB/YihY/UPF0761 family membrane protein